LSHFRIKELKDVLDQLGLSKQGKKQVCPLQAPLHTLFTINSHCPVLPVIVLETSEWHRFLKAAIFNSLSIWSSILFWGIWKLLLMTQVVLVFLVCLQDLVDRVMTVLLSQQDQCTVHSLSPKLIVLHYYFSSMRNNFSFILVASETNGLPKAKMVVKIVEDTFR
jgi:hypothetical protein